MNLMRGVLFLPIALILLIAPFGVASAGAPDWDAAPGARITLFYPGVASWEFLKGEDHRLGGRGIERGKKDCRHCHLSREGVLDLKAEEILAGSIRMKRSHRPFEPEPGPLRKGVITAAVQAAYDDAFLYVRVSWDSEGSAWKADPAEVVVPERVSMQVNAGEALFAKYGCFISCHDDAASMPASPTKQQVAANPYYARLGRDDVRLYADYARNGWREAKGTAALEKIRSAGGLIDLLSVELSRGRAVAMDGWVLDDRRWQAESGNLEATASWADGGYSVVFKRRLDLKGARDVAITDGGVVSAGLSIHDSGSVRRKHFVSFPFTIGLGKKAEVEAVRVK